MDYRAIIEEEAKKAGIRVYYHDRGAQWGRSDLGRKRIFIPTPKRFPSFFTGLHEIGHIMSNHHSWDGKPEYLWEFEAFSWAFNFCRRRGIEVPQRTIEYERSLIAEKVRAAVNGGSRMINRTVVSFIMEGDGEADPDTAFVKTNLSDKGAVLNHEGVAFIEARRRMNPEPESGRAIPGRWFRTPQGPPRGHYRK